MRCRFPGRQTLQGWARAAFQLIAPNHCLACRRFDAPGDDPWLCDSCRAFLPEFRPPLCRRCGFPGVDSGHCRECRRFSFAFDRHRALGPLTDALALIIRRLKRPGNRHLAATLVDLIGRSPELVAYIGGVDLVTCVPLSPRRLRQRGYNQAWELARRLAAQRRLYFDGTLLRKTGDRPAQRGQTLKQRLQDMDALFDCGVPNQLPMRTILLVDDVMTTGATLSACSRAIKRRLPGVKVFCLTAARTMEPESD